LRGWFRSVRTGLPEDPDGKPLPWYTFPSISYLSGIDMSRLSVFEFGMGNSTLWWAERVLSVCSCDHDAGFERMIRNRLPSNARSLGAFVDKEAYLGAIGSTNESFDIVVVDGRWRNESIRRALGCLRAQGVILLDNSDRAEYEEGRKLLASEGFRELPFLGMGPINHYEWKTSIFYRCSNCLGI